MSIFEGLRPFQSSTTTLAEKVRDARAAVRDLESELGAAALAHEEGPTKGTEAAMTRLGASLDRAKLKLDSLVLAEASATARATRDAAAATDAAAAQTRAALLVDVKALGAVGQRINKAVAELNASARAYHDAQISVLSHIDPARESLQAGFGRGNLWLLAAVAHALRDLPGAKKSPFLDPRRLENFAGELPTAKDIR